MKEIRIEPRGPFSLQWSRAFLEGFTPASSSVETAGDLLILSFRMEGKGDAAAVALRQDGAVVRGELVGTTEVAGATRQIARILSLDHDAGGWVELGRRDPVIGMVIAERPGFRPVCFASPYEAAIWAILAQRINMGQAARLRRALAEAEGELVEIAGRRKAVVPRPERLARLRGLPGLPQLKVDRLRGIGEAAKRGLLDADRLRALEPETALEELSALPGVGPWSARHILLRGTGPTDGISGVEPRLREAARLALGLKTTPSESGYEELAERWRPWRMWAAVGLVSHYGDRLFRRRDGKGDRPRGARCGAMGQ